MNDEIQRKIDSHSLWLRTNGAEGEKANLVGVDLEGANLAGADLCYANLRRANLNGVNLSDANLNGVNLEKANLTEADLYGAKLRGANLTGTILEKKETVSSNVDLRAKFDELAKSLGLKIISLKVEKTETIDL